MEKYHINPETGQVNLCRANSLKTKGCPFGGEGDHYSSKESAHLAYEKRNESLNSVSLKKSPKKSKSQIELEGRIKKWGPVGGGPITEGLSSDEAFEVRKRYAESLIADHRLTAETDDEVISEKAHKSGIPSSFLKNQIMNLKYDSERAERKKAWDAKYGKDAPKVEPKQIPGTSFEIDNEWTNIQGEGRFKFIKSISGKGAASIQIRDGFYILGARDEAGGYVHFQKNSFISENDAVDYLLQNKKLLEIA